MIDKLNKSLFLFTKLIDIIKEKEGIHQSYLYTKQSTVKHTKLNNKEYGNHKA